MTDFIPSNVSEATSHLMIKLSWLFLKEAFFANAIIDISYLSLWT